MAEPPLSRRPILEGYERGRVPEMDSDLNKVTSLVNGVHRNMERSTR